MTTAAPNAEPRPPGTLAQAFAVGGGMAAWGVALLVAYPTVQLACAAGLPVLVHLVRWIALAVAIAATLTGWRVAAAARDLAGSSAAAGAARGADAEGAHPDAEAESAPAARIERLRFMGLGGALLSASGAFLLVVEDLAAWVIHPCL